jgi:hypothetical protein
VVRSIKVKQRLNLRSGLYCCIWLGRRYGPLQFRFQWPQRGEMGL